LESALGLGKLQLHFWGFLAGTKRYFVGNGLE
jgi:hypothetical protein